MEFGAAGQNLAISGNKTKKPFFVYLRAEIVVLAIYCKLCKLSILYWKVSSVWRTQIQIFFTSHSSITTIAFWYTFSACDYYNLFGAQKPEKNRLSGRHCGRDPFWPSHCKPQSKQPWMSASGQLHFRPLHVIDSSHLLVCFAFWSLVFRTLLKYEIGYLVALESPVMWRQRIGCKIH